MTSANELPQIMANAREDLAGNVEGQFSPTDWEEILTRAREQLLRSPKGQPEAWVDVIRDFHREKYWGFIPNYKKPKTKLEDENLGVRFIWYCCRSFLVTKLAVLWFGCRYSAYGDPLDKWLFIGAIAFMLINYGIFLWRYGNKHDG